MNGSYSSSNCVVHLRGLAWNTTPAEIQNFLQGCKIRQTNLVTNEQGRTTGECFVVLESNEDVELAKSFQQKTLGNRYIEVLESNLDEMTKNTSGNSQQNSDNSSSNSNTENWQEPVVRLRGLPYNSSKDDVTHFFEGLDIAQNGVHISSSKPAGEAFVAFMNMDNALRALEFNRMNMGHRYIEVFKSSYAEARASIMNDSQSVARQRSSNNTSSGNTSGSNQNYGSQRQGNYGSYSGNMSGGGPGRGNSGYNNNQNNNNMNDYSGPPSNNYNYNSSGNTSNNYNPGGGGGVKRPMSVSFTMKIRGVPFEASEKDVFEFFSPIVPIRLEQENTPRGKPPIWYAEFGSREEATEALTYHKKYMGTRYIELLPLYDDGNRSKTTRH